MKKISALFLSLCILFTFIMPIQAFAVDGEAIGISTSEDDTAGESLPDDDSCAATLGTSGEPGGISPFSGWEGGDSEFFTRIRLTVTDRDGNPLGGVVYGLYRTDDSMLIQYLTTDRFGIAVSDDIPVDTNYYLLEYAGPEGFLPNTEPKYIDLTQICAPSRVDENVVYDPVAGYIKIIKTDEDGNPLSNVGFYIYRNSNWQLMDTVYTDDNGEATSTLLRYGNYAVYEFDVPEGMAGSGYSYVQIENDGEVHEVYITNYLARGYLRIYKKGNDDRVISGAVFSIYKVDSDEWIEDITTGSSGYAYSSAMPIGDYYAVEKSVPSPYALSSEKHYFNISYDGHTAYLNIINNVGGESGKIRVIKTDDSIEPVPLSGVVFGVYRTWDNKKITEITTQSDGTAEYTLIPGNYYLVELSGKPGYTMASGQIPFTIDGSGATVEKTVVNPRIRIFGKVKIIKKDDAGTPIPDVRFGVYCDKGNLLEELVTGSDGTATSGVLNEGTGYYLVELSEVAGHLSDTQTHYPFDITQNGTIMSVAVTNPRITGGIKVIKDDGEGNPLAGVVFGLYKNGVKLAELTTIGDGTATSDVLYYGSDYELRELSTVEGYELISTPIPFSILEQDVIVEIPVSNSKILGSVTIIKVDADDIENGEMPPQSEIVDSPLVGALFGLYNNKGQKIAELTIDGTGRATYEGLPKSGYWIKELAAPEGYVATDDIIPFEINEQGEEIQFVVPNAKGFGTIKIIKHGEGELLPGVVFELYRTATNEKIMELTTDENGEVSQVLPLGRYYLREKSTVAGYSLLSGSVSFTLTTEGATVELPIQNQKEPAPDGGKIKLIKKSAADGSKLPGAVFGLYRSSDDVKLGELVTGSTGLAFSEALPEIELGYYLLELTAPVNYQLLTEKLPVKVKNGETVEITVENQPVIEEPKPGKAVIMKESKTTGVRLKNAVFGIFKTSDDSKVGEITTQTDGTASMVLPAGDYYCKELVPPANFKLNDLKFSFHISSGKTIEIVVLNEPADPILNPGRLIVIKSAEGTGIRLRNATFDVFRVSDNERIAQITTDRNGEAELLLSEDEFYLRETKAPNNYRLDSSKITFTIKANETAIIRVTNKLKSRSASNDQDPDPDRDDSPNEVEIVTVDSPFIPVEIEPILLPKTGEAFPLGWYAIAAVCFAVSAACCWFVCRKGRLSD